MCLDQPLTYGQSQPRTQRISCQVLTVQNTIEFVEHSLQISDRNSRTTIGNVDLHLLSLVARTHLDWRFRRRIAHSVLNEICQNLVNLQVVQVDQQQII